MKKSFYIFSSGKLRRKDNTIYLEIGENQTSKHIPIENVSDIHLFGEIELNTKLLAFLSKHQAALHYYDYYGYYRGTFAPKQENISGLVVIAQAKHYLDPQLRLEVARAMLEGSIYNMYWVLRYYAARGKELEEQTSILSSLSKRPSTIQRIEELRGLEGHARETYYKAWQEILTSEGFALEKRAYNPPSNPVNALISFGNGLLYAITVSELLHTHLHPGVSFIHEPGSYRFSLALDIADIFKPVLVDRLIFRLINQNQIQLKDFDENLGHAYLKESGRKIFIQKWEEQLSTTIQHPTLSRSVSYRRLIRLECYRLLKHFLGDKPYKAFRPWW